VKDKPSDEPKKKVVVRKKKRPRKGRDGEKPKLTPQQRRVGSVKATIRQFGGGR
jgi:hypothetical protein